MGTSFVIRNSAAVEIGLGTAMDVASRVRAASMSGPDCTSGLMQSLAVRLNADNGLKNSLEDGYAARKLLVLELFNTSAA